jgi:hypothetical protein
MAPRKKKKPTPEPKAPALGTIARNPFGGTANALEARVAILPQAPKDKTAGANSTVAGAQAYEQRVVSQN